MDIEDEYDKIFRFCYWKVHDREIAEDLTQETFLRFLDSKYSEQGKRLRYIYTIARNLCIDEHRKRMPVEIPEEFPDTETADERTDKVFLQQVLQQLPEEDQELLVMRYVNQESLGTISEITGSSRFALYRRLKRIREIVGS